MNDSWTQMWNNRYSREEYAYGIEPNSYFRENLEKLPVSKILLPADGEGRNGVFAAKLGWKVSEFDISVEGQKKALQLAKREDVSIDYRVGDLSKISYAPGEFDVIALIYAHFPATVKSAYHRQLDSYLKPGGYVIFEAFSKDHLAYIARNERVGGPRDIESLFSVEEIKHDFPNYEILQLEQAEVSLDEGPYHDGLGSVIRFLGRKPQ